MPASQVELRAPNTFVPPAPRVASSAAKRIFDVIAGGLAALLLLPVAMLIALAIRIESPGPVLFTQRRTGLNGGVFVIYKFRTMHAANSAAEVQQATREDGRVTPIGRILRRTSLDELPQLLNVLRGEMSIVGPRPHAVEHDLHFAQIVACYQARFLARPGLTGLAQISGLRGEIKGPGCIEKRVAADITYIESWSFWRDLKIISQTLPHLLFTQAAY